MEKIANEPIINKLGQVVHYAVRGLAVLMTLVILWGVIDVGLILYQEIVTPPYGLLSSGDILTLFGSFLAVLIAIEIFQNITIYLKEEVIHVQIVIATALMAISRKIIVLDFKEVDAEYVWASAAVILALGVTYWLIAFQPKVLAIDLNNRAT
ncbi:phosphate-starvation-inducible PsiE family protein [Shewanella benthica]|uniref:phosphate-starvation-inducible PsiE family protein n=1 Tax=Shewanella benthica TaxID=43661 RepID=UPI0018794B2C|nr:phosphate-starvation-inducible PsiE family protein [Shewanella benthica]MBE7216564.1 phosphate-starvation-inducible PsiE family protein [Shewanella benthica]MCL1064691.1 phosphate-starvation-inducible PsiE family protein [Shewanella benthica]